MVSILLTKDSVMSDVTKTTEPIEPFMSSADGKRNSYTLNCLPTGQSMNYAACLWRQGVLSNPATNVPADWSACRTARGEGRCTAVEMRKEEEIAGFKDRNFIRKMTDAARKWIGTSTTFSSKPAPKVVATTSMLDAIGGAGSLADAISSASMPTPVVAMRRATMPSMLPGETPLQMMRRITNQGK
jgi:hypothetical protein